MPDPLRWSRLEPDTRDTSLAAGLEARVHDPLWLLARQRQLGELTADADLGAVVTAELTAEVAQLGAYRAGASNGTGVVSYDPHAVPLQAVVEAESVAPTARLAVRAGLHFLRLLTAHGVGKYAAAYRAQFPLKTPTTVPDADSRRFLDVVMGRAPDGVKLHKNLAAALRPAHGAGKLPAKPKIAAADAAGIRAAALAFLDWYHALYVVPAGGDAWTTARMEYAFGVDAAVPDAAIALDADEYSDGRLDWYAFRAAAAGKAPAAKPTTVGPLTVVPSPVAYPGMPAPRFWEFEDAVVDFGGIEAEPADIGRMLLTEFALVFGGDWLLIPLEVPLGSLVRIVSLDVRDTFGRTLRVGPTSALEGALGGWRMFTLAGGDSAPASYRDALLVPPVLAPGLQGPDLEEVLLLRDETANLAWAVERRIEGQNGAPVDRAEVAHQADGEPSPARSESTGVFAYRLAGTVPEYWLPLFPERTHPDDPSIGLRLGALPQTFADASSRSIPPLGRLLQPPPGGALVVGEEEVPREGVSVTRGYQLARWMDGSTFLWLARRKTVGRGEGSSGLCFDSMDDGAPQSP